MYVFIVFSELSRDADSSRSGVSSFNRRKLPSPPTNPDLASADTSPRSEGGSQRQRGSMTLGDQSGSFTVSFDAPTTPRRSAAADSRDRIVEQMFSVSGSSVTPKSRERRVRNKPDRTQKPSSAVNDPQLKDLVIPTPRRPSDDVDDAGADTNRSIIYLFRNLNYSKQNTSKNFANCTEIEAVMRWQPNFSLLILLVLLEKHARTHTHRHTQEQEN